MEVEDLRGLGSTLAALFEASSGPGPMFSAVAEGAGGPVSMLPDEFEAQR